MSIYSGFATRNQENFYNRLVDKLLRIMSNRLLCFYSGNASDTRLEDPNERDFKKKLHKIYKALLLMENTKYLEPHFSHSFSELVLHFKNRVINNFYKIQGELTVNNYMENDQTSDLTSNPEARPLSQEKQHPLRATVDKSSPNK